MDQKLYEVDIKIHPIPPPSITPITPIVPVKSKSAFTSKNYTNYLEASSSDDKSFTDLCKRDSMIVVKKKSKCLCIRWC